MIILKKKRVKTNWKSYISKLVNTIIVGIYSLKEYILYSSFKICCNIIIYYLKLFERL